MSTLTQSLPTSTGNARSLAPFYLGAAADVVVGLALTLFGPALAQLLMPAHEQVLGMPAGVLLRVLGIALIVFAIDTVIVARSRGTLARFRSWIIKSNFATAAFAMVLLLAAHSAFSAFGIAAIVIIAVALAGIALWQHKVS